MSKEREYEELYDRLLREVSTLHRNNRRRIRIGMKMLVAVTVGLMLLMFLSQGNKIFSLMLWIFSMFAVAAYLIAVEYADYELQKKLEYITQMQQQSMGALLMLPELPEEFEAHEEGAFDIVRTKRFTVKPMSVEEAILQMNLLGHSFFVFRNTDFGDAICVVYRRNNGGYGIIETEDDEE